jgi:hypothetical protein
MNTTVRSGLLLAIAILAACGQSTRGTSKNAGTTPTSPAAPAAPTATGTDPVLAPEAVSTRAFIRMLGTDNPGYDALLADVALVTVEVNGAPVALDYTGVQTMDLTNPDQAWRVASFAMPAPGSTVHVTVQLDDPAIWERAGDSGELDTCGIPIEFTAPAEWFALRGHAVIVLDLAASIAGPSGSPVLLPNLQVMY